MIVGISAYKHNSIFNNATLKKKPQYLKEESTARYWVIVNIKNDLFIETLKQLNDGDHKL